MNQDRRKGPDYRPEAERLCAELPTPVLAQSLDEFEVRPHRALHDAAAGGATTVLYTIVPDGPAAIRAAAVAVVLPFDVYRGLVSAGVTTKGTERDESATP
jgi:hypothetical protein